MATTPRHTSNDANARIARSPLLAKIPAGAAVLSAIIYFMTSEGIRNHLDMLIGALSKLARLAH